MLSRRNFLTRLAAAGLILGTPETVQRFWALDRTMLLPGGESYSFPPDMYGFDDIVRTRYRQGIGQKPGPTYVLMHPNTAAIFDVMINPIGWVPPTKNDVVRLRVEGPAGPVSTIHVVSNPRVPEDEILFVNRPQIV